MHGFHDKKTQIRYFIVSGVIALASGIFTYVVTGYDLNVLLLIALGAFFLLFYTFPLKFFAMGEISIFLIWGPVMIAGVFYVLTGDFNWHVLLASISVGLSVMSINLGKHVDKRDDDVARKVHTLPVVIGEKAARYLDIFSLIMAYAIIIYLVIVQFYTPVMLIVFFAGKQLLMALAVLTKPKPSEPPEEYPGWPLWFSAFTFIHNRRFTLLFIIGLLVDTILRVYVPTFWAGVTHIYR